MQDTLLDKLKKAGMVGEPKPEEQPKPVPNLSGMLASVAAKLEEQGVEPVELSPTRLQAERAGMGFWEKLPYNAYNVAQSWNRSFAEVAAGPLEAAGQLTQSDTLRGAAAEVRSWADYDERMMMGGQPTVEPGWQSDAAGAGGSAAGFVLGGAAMGGVRALTGGGRIASTILGSGSKGAATRLGAVTQAQSMYRDAEANGAPLSMQYKAFFSGLPLGAIEGLTVGGSGQIGKLAETFAEIDTRSGGALGRTMMGFVRVGGVGAIEAGEEAIQEGVQTFSEKMIAQKLLEYAEPEDWDTILEAVAHNALLGAIVGQGLGSLGIVGQDLGTRRAQRRAGASQERAPRLQAEPASPEEQSAAQERLQGAEEYVREEAPVRVEPEEAAARFARATGLESHTFEEVDPESVEDAPEGQEDLLGLVRLLSGGATMPRIVLVSGERAKGEGVENPGAPAAYINGNVVLDASRSGEALAQYVLHELVHGKIPAGTPKYKEAVEIAQAEFPTLALRAAEAYEADFVKANGRRPFAAVPDGPKRDALMIEEAFAWGAQNMQELVTELVANPGSLTAESLNETRGLFERLRDFFTALLNKLPGLNIDPTAKRKLTAAIQKLTKPELSGLGSAEEVAALGRVLSDVFQSVDADVLREVSKAVPTAEAFAPPVEEVEVTEEDQAMADAVDVEALQAEVDAESAPSASVVEGQRETESPSTQREAEGESGATETVDPNIGRSWDSVKGRRSVVKLERVGGQGRYFIGLEGQDRRVFELVSPEELEERIEFDARQLESRQRAERAEAGRAEEARERKAAQDAESPWVPASERFAETLPPRSKPRALKALKRMVKRDGALIPRAELIWQKVQEGWRVVDVGEPASRRFEGPNGAFLPTPAVTKTGLAFADFLAADTVGVTQPSAAVAPTAQPAAPAITAPVAGLAGARAMPPNALIFEVRDMRGNPVDVVAAPFDGTKEGAREVNSDMRFGGLEDLLGVEVSNMNTRTGTTDAFGQPKWTVSPNGSEIHPVGSPESLHTLKEIEFLPGAMPWTAEQAEATEPETEETPAEPAEDAVERFERGDERWATPEPGPTIEVDGVERPRLNSEGKPIAGTDDALRSFWKWFGESKVVDEQGRPLVVYHGTGAEFTEYESGRPAFFTQSARYASERSRARSGAPNVMPVYLAVSNPLSSELRKGEFSVPKFEERVFGRAREQGRDGAIVDARPPAMARMLRAMGYEVSIRDDQGLPERYFVAFRPEQVKSALGNRGTFSAADPDIRFAAAPAWDTDEWRAMVARMDPKLKVDGQAKLLMHGTAAEFTEPKGVFWASETPELANEYADLRDYRGGGGGRVMPVVLDVQRLFDADAMPKGATVMDLANALLNQRKAEGRGLPDGDAYWALIDRIRAGEGAEESGPTHSRHDFWMHDNAFASFGADGAKAVIDLIEMAGFDGIAMTEQQQKTYAALRRGQVKSIWNQRPTSDPDMRWAAAYHGSPHDFDEFSTNKIGTGEGRQAYGWGLYFAERREVAEWYKENIGGRGYRVLVDGGEWLMPNARAQGLANALGFLHDHASVGSALIALDELGGIAGGSYQRAAKWIRENEDRIQIRNAGSGYEVTLAPDEQDYLLWDEPLSKQSDKVRGALGGLALGSGEIGELRLVRDARPRGSGWFVTNRHGIKKHHAPTRAEAAAWAEEQSGEAEARKPIARTNGERLYRDLSRSEGSDRAASEALLDAGIRGIKYLDGDSRSSGKGAYNYVIFDDADVEITERWAAAPKDRVPQLVDAARAMLERGEVTREEYRRLVDKHKPVQVYDHVPEPATEDEMERALGKKGDKIGAEQGVPEGERVGLRLDIPAYTRHGVWVPTIHAGKGPSKVIGYNSVAAVTNAEFRMSENAALKIAAGGAKAPFAMIRGDHVKITPKAAKARAEEALGDPSWVQVGMDPERHGYFYNRETHDVIESADEVIQVGPLVLARNPVYGDLSQARFAAPAPEPESDVSINMGRLTWWDKARRYWQDFFHPVRKIQGGIEKDRGSELPDEMNVSQAQRLYYGRIDNALEKQRESAGRQLASILGKDISIEEAHRYAYARHASERNAYIYKQDKKWHPEKNPGSGMRSSVAAKIVNEAQAGPNAARYKRLDTFLRRQNRKAIKILRDAGELPPGLEEAIEKQGYEHYVPLVHEMKREDGTVQTSRPLGFSSKGANIQRAQGRKSEPDNVVLNTLAAVDDAIFRAEKRRVVDALVKTIEAYPDDTFWKVHDVPVRIEADEDGVLRQHWEMRTDWKDNYIPYYKDGKAKVIVFAPRAEGLARAMRGGDLNKIGPIVKNLRHVTRYMSAVNTSLNPEFVLTNFVRDLGTAGLVTAEGSSWKAAKAITSKALSAARGIRRTETGKESDWNEWWERLKAAGGKTGWFHAKSLEEMQGDLEAQIREAVGEEGKLRGSLKYAKAVKDVVDGWNEAVENGVRLSAFRYAVENGATDAQAAELAKKLTIDFNTKGENTAFSALYMFANASIQGSVRVAASTITTKRGRRIAASIAALGMMSDALNYMLAGDDDDGENRWDAVPEWKKDRYLMLYTGIGEGGFLSIPLPYGFSFFASAGRNTSAVMRGLADEGGVGAMEGMANTVSSALTSFSPVGDAHNLSAGSMLRVVLPTAADPMVEIATNENYLGRPIYPDYSKFDRTPPPDSEEAFKHTGEMWKDAATMLNAATGGTRVESGLIDVHPDTIRHVVGTALGGMLRTANHTIESGELLMEGEPLSALARAPFSRQLFTQEYARKGYSSYYENSQHVLTVSDHVEQYQLSDDPDDAKRAREILDEHGAVAKLLPEVEKLEKKRKRAQKLIEAMDEGPEREAAEAKLYEQIRAFNRKYQEANQ